MNRDDALVKDSALVISISSLSSISHLRYLCDHWFWRVVRLESRRQFNLHEPGMLAATFDTTAGDVSQGRAYHDACLEAWFAIWALQDASKVG